MSLRHFGVQIIFIDRKYDTILLKLTTASGLLSLFFFFEHRNSVLLTVLF